MGLGAREEGLSRLLAGEWCSRNVKADEQVRTPGALGCPGRAPSTPRPPRAVGTRDGGGLGDAPPAGLLVVVSPVLPRKVSDPRRTG